MKVLVFAALVVLTQGTFASTEQNKKIVLDFYDLAFNQHQVLKAATTYLSEEYIQHNPHVASGRAAFIAAFKDEKDVGPRTIFVRTIAEGDLVVLHSQKPGVAGVDIFRLKHGKIVEHWDVNQKIPEVSKNNNTMF